jgi:hypothetical protein
MVGPGINLIVRLRFVLLIFVQSFSFTSGDAVGTTVSLWVESPHSISWLSQANYIFRRLGISRDFEDYGTSFTMC